jgi:hypothetical protein
MIFRQLFEPVSSSYSYLLASRRGGEALIIDLTELNSVDPPRGFGRDSSPLRNAVISVRPFLLGGKFRNGTQPPATRAARYRTDAQPRRRQ